MLFENEFGGKIELLNKINITGHKNPDFLWSGKLWEIKSVKVVDVIRIINEDIPSTK